MHSTNSTIGEIKIGFLNVHGLKFRVKFYDFEEYVSKYDIVCFSETFINENEFKYPLDDNETLQGYRLMHKPPFLNPKCSQK